MIQLFIGELFEKIYFVFSIIMIIVIIRTVWRYFTDGAQKRLEFIMKAQDDGRFVTGKLCCLTKEGTKESYNYCAEYIYVVEGKRYFVTYQISPEFAMKLNKEGYDTDSMVFEVQPFITLFYDEKDPKKVYSKASIFASKQVLLKVKNKKENMYRDIDKNWAYPVDLTI